MVAVLQWLAWFCRKTKCRFCYNIIQQAITTTIQRALGNTRMEIPKHHNVKNKECWWWLFCNG